MRYIRVGEELKYFLEIECRVVLWVWPEVLDRNCNQCSDSGRE